MANKITVALLLFSILYLFPSHATLLDTKKFVHFEGNSILFFLLISLIANFIDWFYGVGKSFKVPTENCSKH